jgi:hypothetical protein
MSSNSATICLKRLPPTTKRTHIMLLLKILTKNNPASFRFVRGVLKSINQKKISSKQAETSLIAHFGRANYKRGWLLAQILLAHILMKNRRMISATTQHACHACLSFEAQVTCPACGRVCFCIGCADYGECNACSAAYD